MTQVRNDRSGVDHYYCSETALATFESTFFGNQHCASVQCNTRVEPRVFLKSGSLSAFFLSDVPWISREQIGKEEEEAPMTQELSTEDYSFYSSRAVSERLLAEVERADAFRGLRQALYTASGRTLPATTKNKGVANSGDDPVRTIIPGVEKPLLTIHELEELPSRWVISSMSAYSALTLPPNGARRSVTGLDVGERVMLRHPSSASGSESHAMEEDRGETSGDRPHPFEIVATSKLCRGEYWVEVVPVRRHSDSYPSYAAVNNSKSVKRVDREDLLLDPPVPLYLDPLLPCDELTTAHASSKCVFLSFFHGAQRITNSKAAADNLAMAKSAEMARIAREWRKRMFDRQREIHHFVVSVPHTGGSNEILSFLEYRGCQRRLNIGMRDQDCLFCDLRTNYSGNKHAKEAEVIKVEILLREVHKLARLWDLTYQSSTRVTVNPFRSSCYSSAEKAVSQCTTSDEHHLFFYHLFIMLLRYQTFFGEKGYNQGPQAAVPPCVMNQLQIQFSTTVEAFASPLNVYAAHLQFCSLFPDVDAPFGGLGSFFDLKLISGHFEVNPPFDAEVLRRMQHHLLDSIAESEKRAANGKGNTPHGEDHQSNPSALDMSSSLLFVVVLPSHDLDPNERDDMASCGGTPSVIDKQGSSRKRKRESSKSTTSLTSTIKRPAVGIAATELSVERALRESEFCLGHILCHASESAYIDGHQHLLRVPLFRIQTPTRLIVLGNSVARSMYPDALQRLKEVKEMWRQWTLSTSSSS